MDERHRAKHVSSHGSRPTEGHALEGRGFYVWDEDAARARAMALELGLSMRSAGGLAPLHPRPRRSSR